MTTVNTVPTAATRTGDFSNYRDRNGNLIPIYDPLTTRLDAHGTDRARSVSQQHHSPGPHSSPSAGTSRASTRCRTTAAATSTTTSRRPTARSPTTRSPAASTTGCRTTTRSSSGSTTASSGSTRRRARRTAACRRRPEAAARFDLGPFVAGIQNTKLTTHGAAFNYSKMLTPDPRQRAARWLRQHRAVHDPVRLRPQRRGVAGHSRHQHQRHHDRACRTSTSRTSPASPADRRSCRSTPASSTTRSRTCWCG